ncbi:hypothetical protein [Herpetosiphon sp. NSE202]|uniref:hypothetical protein n=1 Tax=Herpetosiphon sp. NSE202 TaxID=3351349 RepID=UPI003636F62B
MTLEDPTRIDIVAGSLDPARPGLDLWVVDTGSISDDSLRYRLLIAKVLIYANYIASPMFTVQHPKIKRADVLVRVVCLTPPTKLMRDVTGIVSWFDQSLRVPVVVEDAAKVAKHLDTCHGEVRSYVRKVLELAHIETAPEPTTSWRLPWRSKAKKTA